MEYHAVTGKKKGDTLTILIWKVIQDILKFKHN